MIKFMRNIYLFFVTYFYRFLTFILPIFISKKSAKDGILFLENFPIENAGYQYRAKKWVDIFNNENLNAEVVTLFEDKNDFEQQFKNDDVTLFFIKSIRKRFKQCLYARKFHAVVVRRELLMFNDYGNLFMDKFLLKIHQNVILDFDDDIAALKQQPREIKSFYGKILQENGNKFNDFLRLYKRFIVGSKYLKERVLQENKTISEHNILIIPTCVDYDTFAPKEYNSKNNEIVFGWIGGNHNLHYLKMLIEPLNKIFEEQKIKLVVSAGKIYTNDKAKFSIENKKWSLATEKDIIRSFDIGLMPIEDNSVGKGKCGFKLLQYMGLGVVSIATNVSINSEIIEHGKNSFLVNNDNSNWYEILKFAINQKTYFSKIGNLAKQTVKERYSFTSNKDKIIKYLTI